jgi:outer membrane protein OmpA-like peptidoglycan-associated protein
MHTFAQKPVTTTETSSAKPATRGPRSVPQSSEVSLPSHGQLTSGNQPSPRSGHDFSRIPVHPPSAAAIQAKLAINNPGDSYEQEADRLAEQVLRTPESRLQRACTCGGGCSKCHAEQPGARHKSLQTKSVQAGYTGQISAPPIVDNVLRSPGQPLDPATRTFMEPRFGYDFSRVRVHSDGAAAKSARDVNAHAYTVGRDIVFGAGRLVPGTQEGRHLIAHELTHVVQQSGAHRGAGPAPANVVQREPTQYYEKTETDVADSIIDALQQSNHIAGLNVDPAFEILNPYPLPFQLRVLADLYDRNYFYGFLGYLAPGTKAGHKLIVAIRFTQCQKDPSLLAYEDILEAQQFLRYDVALPPEQKAAFECLERERVRLESQREEDRRQRELQKDNQRFDAVFEPGSEFCSLKKGMMKWRLYPPTAAEGTGKKQRIQIKFLPDLPYRNKTVTFLQTMIEEGGGGRGTTVDIGVNVSVFRPFYGVNWNEPLRRWVPSNEGTKIGFRSQPNSADDPAAYMFDEPYFFPPPHGRVFESVAVVLETGETLGALTWGVGTVPTYAQKPTCADRPSAAYHTSTEKFYTPESPAPAHGQENYDLIFDGFAPNSATLTAEQNKQLDSIAARVKEMIGTGDPEATADHLLVGGFGDSMDTDPMAASEQRTQSVANYLSAKGVPKVTLDLRPFGAAWARFELNTKQAQEGRNRRIQIRLF